MSQAEGINTGAGTKLKMSEKVDEGMKLYQEAIAVCPSYGPAYYNIGVVWSEARDVRPSCPSARASSLLHAA